VKKVKRRVPWVEHLIEDVSIARDLNYDVNELKVRVSPRSLCLACRGGKALCGKPRCPALMKLYSYVKVKNRIEGTELEGSSPPGVFVGRMGYPYVYAGPLVPPILGDTFLLDAPEHWLGKPVDEIVDFRTKLVRGKFRVNVRKPEKNGKLMDRTRELALSNLSVETEVSFKKKPGGRFFFDGEVQPMGPSAILKGMEIGSTKVDHKVEKAYGDDDLKATDAVLGLYQDEVSVSRIQKAFSVGAFGLKNQRRLVPTRWSITAVDSIVSQRLIGEEVKGKPAINEYRVYELNYLENRFVVLMMPSGWKYEWVEAWYPGTAWNPQSQSIAMCGDYEEYKGRTTYSTLGGCYYAVRLAAAEHLAAEGRQASVVALREIHPGFITPLGVWINREGVREALRMEPKKFNELKEALGYVASRFEIRLEDWVKTSTLLKDAMHQEKLTKYFNA
jgi:hypothetical protein